MSRITKLMIGAVVATLAALGLITLWPLCFAGSFGNSFYQDTAAMVWSGLGLLPVVFVFGIILSGFLTLILRRSSERVLKIYYFGLLPGAAATVIAVGLLRFLAATPLEDLPVEHVAAVNVATSPLILNLGPYTLAQPDASVSGNYLATGNNVVSLASFPPQKLFPRPIEHVSDLYVRGSALMVISGRRLFVVNQDSTYSVLAMLPFDGMKIAPMIDIAGLKTPILLWGNNSGKGYVYELDADETYSEIARTDEPISGSSGCSDATAVAFSDRVVFLAPGHYPRLLFRLPKGAAPITSVLARSIVDADTSCAWLIATENDVYEIEDGPAVLLIAGVGGILSNGGERESDPGNEFDFVVTDQNRNTIINVSLNSVSH